MASNSGLFIEQDTLASQDTQMIAHTLYMTECDQNKTKSPTVTQLYPEVFCPKQQIILYC